jgi:hypothetical protein
MTEMAVEDRGSRRVISGNPMAIKKSMPVVTAARTGSPAPTVDAPLSIRWLNLLETLPKLLTFLAVLADPAADCLNALFRQLDNDMNHSLRP